MVFWKYVVYWLINNGICVHCLYRPKHGLA